MACRQTSDLIVGSAQQKPLSGQHKERTLKFGVTTTPADGIRAGIWSDCWPHSPLKVFQGTRQKKYIARWCYCSPNRHTGAGIIFYWRFCPPMKASQATRETVLKIGANTAMLNRLRASIRFDSEYHSLQAHSGLRLVP